MCEIQEAELELQVKEPVIVENTMIRFSGNSRYLTAFAARDILISELVEIYKNTLARHDADPAVTEQKFIVALDEKGLIFIVPQALVEFFPDKPIISFTVDQVTHNYSFVNDDMSYVSTPEEFRTCSTRHIPCKAKPGFTRAPHNSTHLHNTDLTALTGGNLTHDEVAGRVRMLTRDQLNHESVCCMARDRIKWLAHRESELVKLNADLTAKNDQLQEHARLLQLELEDARAAVEIEQRIREDV